MLGLDKGKRGKENKSRIHENLLLNIPRLAESIVLYKPFHVWRKGHTQMRSRRKHFCSQIAGPRVLSCIRIKYARLQRCQFR